MFSARQAADMLLSLSAQQPAAHLPNDCLSRHPEPTRTLTRPRCRQAGAGGLLYSSPYTRCRCVKSQS